jgi:hypothetical protein
MPTRSRLIVQAGQPEPRRYRPVGLWLALRARGEVERGHGPEGLGQ